MNAFTQLSSKQKKIYTASFLLTLTAIVVTIILINTHFETSEGGSFCNISDYWNCDRVNKSTFAEILGIPVSLLGFLFYSFFAVAQFLLLKGANIEKILPPFLNVKSLAISALAVSVAGAGILLYQEMSMLGPLAVWGAIKNVIFILLPVRAYLAVAKNPSPSAYYSVFLLILALFGVNFALYLTNVELFVLEAICIFCFTQQILIILITVFLSWGLKLQLKKHQN
ncbi:hypothetical protein IT411_01830 [Candidatus Peregrinibacteria bacterium]|nr:hypothetical protein [Candidatus Peregrinibacteria bacterium]